MNIAFWNKSVELGRPLGNLLLCTFSCVRNAGAESICLIFSLPGVDRKATNQIVAPSFSGTDGVACFGCPFDKLRVSPLGLRLWTKKTNAEHSGVNGEKRPFRVASQRQRAIFK